LSEVEPPAFPKPENLIEFYVGPVTTNKYFIDASTLSVGSDRIVRYVLVVRTSGGASNVSFEGINCKELTWKHYATGRSDGTWTKSRAARTSGGPSKTSRSIAPCRIESRLFLSGRHRHQYRRRRAQRAAAWRASQFKLTDSRLGGRQ
jgi:hypothetical protein